MVDDQFPGYRTRREARAAAGAAAEPAAPLVTRRESEGFSTRREGAVEDLDVIIGLPSVLRARYTVINELPNPGTEADVLLVRDNQVGAGGDDLRVVKLYRQGIRAEQEVWAKVRSMTSPHVVRILDTGTAAGRDYEVMEYLPGGNLTELPPAPGVRLAVGVVVEVVRQVAEGLIGLHGLGIVHRDLKPENVLIRRTRPLELVVTDFGLSRVHEQSMVAASRSGTMAYLAPEILLSTGAVSSKARDWWALGMMVRELLTGVRPFEEMTAKGIDRALMLRGVDLGNIDDPRMRLLCRGLLVRDMEDRWGAEQVLDWLGGGSPEVLDEGSGSGDELKPFIFEGQAYREKKALARAFARSWEKAARRYFVGMGTDTDSSEGWLALRTWLQQFSNPEVDDVEGLVELIDEQLKPGDIRPDVKLLSLLRWLDPNLPAIYRGQSVSREHLVAIAAQARSGEGTEQAAAVRVVQDLFAEPLLPVPVLGQMQNGTGLARLERDWRALLEDYDERVSVRAGGLPVNVRTALRSADAGRVQATLLGLALDPAGLGAQLREDVAERTRLLPVRLPWFDELARAAAAGSDPVDDVICLIVYPVAAREAEMQAAATKQQQDAERARREVWDQREKARRAGAEAATTKAWIYLGICLTLMVVAFVLNAGGRGALMNVLSVLAGLLAGGYLVWSELEFAQRLGTDYADFTPLGNSGQLIRTVGERLRHAGAGPGIAVLIGLFVVFGIAVSVPFVAYGAAAGAHAWFLNSRQVAWRNRHDEERRQALSEDTR
jgi:serine/threonine protein kinase